MIELSVENNAGTALHAPSPTVIKIVGCGGGGSSAVNRMVEAGVSDVEFVVLNTDMQALQISKAQTRLPIGQELTGGLGAGGNPEVGENAAMEDKERIAEVLSGADMVIITAGMGGGTGTGSAPIVAQIAHDQGALTVAVVTTPFEFEAKIRMEYAQNGLKKLREHVDSLIIIPNQQIMKIVGGDKKLSYKQSFRLADDVLCQGVQGITEIITKPGEVNCDFADVKTVMKNQGDAILGVGIAEGENRAVEAAQKAITNPMLENRHIDGASNILVNITSAEDLAMVEVEEIIRNITASANERLKLFWGQVLDPTMGDKISVTVIATGFEPTDEDLARMEKEEQARRERSNVMSYSDFERLVNGSPAEPKEEKGEITGKFSTVPVDADALFAKESDTDSLLSDAPSSSSIEATLEDSLKQAMSSQRTRMKNDPPPSFNRDSSDLTQPAVWRRKLDGLNRNIDLTLDD